MNKNQTQLYGGIEAGGTKFICAIGPGDTTITNETVIKTTTPEQTLSAVIDFFRSSKQTLQSIGIGSFGPIETNRQAKHYGYITSTPKVAWQHCNIVGELSKALQIPIGFTTDVNAAALGEYHYGAGQQYRNFLYITVGTGIGAAAIIDGKLLAGLAQPEMGHITIHPQTDDHFAGVCHYHKTCFEGLACGEAIKQRWQVKSALDLPKDHQAWQLEADYIAQGVLNYISVLSPQRVIIGGGVMKQQQLYKLVQHKIIALNKGYYQLPVDLASYIVPPGLQNRAGVIGALVLARQINHEH